MRDKSQASENGEVREIFGESAHRGAVFEGRGKRGAVEDFIEKESSLIDGEKLGGTSGREGCQSDEGVKGARSLGAIVGGAREEEEREVATECGDEQLGKVVKSKGSEEEVSR